MMTLQLERGSVAALIARVLTVVTLSQVIPAWAELSAIDKLVLDHQLSTTLHGRASTDLLEDTIRMYGSPGEVHPDMIRWFNVDGCRQIALLRGSVSNDWLGYRMVMRNGATRGSIEVRTNSDNQVTQDTVDAAWAKYDYEAFETIYATNKSELPSGAPNGSRNPVVFTFAGAQLGQVANVMSEWSGETITVAPDTHLEVYAKSPEMMSPALAYRAMLAYLKTRGIVLQRHTDQVLLKWAEK